MPNARIPRDPLLEVLSLLGSDWQQPVLEPRYVVAIHRVRSDMGETDVMQNNGSITSPASRACCIGFKPTAGLISRAGAWPANTYQDSPGQMTRSVEDAARILEVLMGELSHKSLRSIVT